MVELGAGEKLPGGVLRELLPTLVPCVVGSTTELETLGGAVAPSTWGVGKSDGSKPLDVGLLPPAGDLSDLSCRAWL